MRLIQLVVSGLMVVLSEGINNNTIAFVLIPKGENPGSMQDYRPIDLCNVIYKILSKALANRLKRVLPHIILEEQSTFVVGRSILDNVLMASEIIHFLKGKRNGKRGDLALKVDINKAYDRVDWGYLRAVMTKMGFNLNWVS